MKYKSTNVYRFKNRFHRKICWWLKLTWLLWNSSHFLTLCKKRSRWGGGGLLGRSRSSLLCGQICGKAGANLSRSPGPLPSVFFLIGAFSGACWGRKCACFISNCTEQLSSVCTTSWTKNVFQTFLLLAYFVLKFNRCQLWHIKHFLPRRWIKANFILRLARKPCSILCWKTFFFLFFFFLRESGKTTLA